MSKPDHDQHSGHDQHPAPKAPVFPAPPSDHQQTGPDGKVILPHEAQPLPGGPDEDRNLPEARHFLGIARSRIVAIPKGVDHGLQAVLKAIDAALGD